jgi:hypothetical protein
MVGGATSAAARPQEVAILAPPCVAATCERPKPGLRARQVRVVAGELRSQVSERVSELAKLMGQHGDTTRDPDSLIFRVNPWARRPAAHCAGRRMSV